MHKLGRRPPDYSRPRLWAEDYYKVAQLPHPAPVDYASGVNFPMYLNDQYGDCLGPDTQLLTADLRWVAARNIRVGDKLLGFDEEPPAGNRQLRVSVVERVAPLVKQSYDLTFSDGTQLRASHDHMWLRKRRPAGAWLKTEDMRAHGARSSSVGKFISTWDELDEYDRGYLAAAFDGEGCLAVTSSGSLKGIQFAQRDNVMLAEVKRILSANGFGFTCMHVSDSALSGNGYELLRVLGGKREASRLLGMVRPKRLLERFAALELGEFWCRPVALTEKKDVGEQTVIAIQTSTRTFIAEGLASHNCTIAGIGHVYGGTSKFALGAEITFSDAEITAVYERNCPGFNPVGDVNDNGCTLQGVLADQSSNGMTDVSGKVSKVTAYAQMKGMGPKDLNVALQLYGAVYCGVNLPQSAESQFPGPWTYVKGSPILGGHCIVLAASNLASEYPYTFVSWGATVVASQEWVHTYLEEAWVAITPDWLTANGNSYSGVDVAELTRDMNAVNL